MKKCSRCKESKPLEQFGKTKSTKDGYRGQCKRCCKILRRSRNGSIESSNTMTHKNDFRCKDMSQSRVEVVKNDLFLHLSTLNGQSKDYLKSLNLDFYDFVKYQGKLYLIENWTSSEYEFIEDKIKHCGIELTNKIIREWVKQDDK